MTPSLSEYRVRGMERSLCYLPVNLRRYRVARGLSQQQLADVARLSCGQSQVSDYERGRAVPTLLSALRVANVLGRTVDDLLSPPEAGEQVRVTRTALSGDLARALERFYGELSTPKIVETAEDDGFRLVKEMLPYLEKGDDPVVVLRKALASSGLRQQ